MCNYNKLFGIYVLMICFWLIFFFCGIVLSYDIDWRVCFVDIFGDKIIYC